MKPKSRMQKHPIAIEIEKSPKTACFGDEITSKIRVLISFVIITAPTILIKSFFKKEQGGIDRFTNLIHNFITCFKTFVYMILNIIDLTIRHYFGYLPILSFSVDYIKNLIKITECKIEEIKREIDYTKLRQERNFKNIFKPDFKLTEFITRVINYFIELIKAVICSIFVGLYLYFEKYQKYLCDLCCKNYNMYDNVKDKFANKNIFDSQKLINIVMKNLLFVLYVGYAMVLIIFFEIYKFLQRIVARLLRIELVSKAAFVLNEAITESASILHNRERHLSSAKDFGSCSDEACILEQERENDISGNKEDKLKML